MSLNLEIRMQQAQKDGYVWNICELVFWQIPNTQMTQTSKVCSESWTTWHILTCIKRLFHQRLPIGRRRPGGWLERKWLTYHTCLSDTICLSSLWPRGRSFPFCAGNRWVLVLLSKPALAIMHLLQLVKYPLHTNALLTVARFLSGKQPFNPMHAYMPMSFLCFLNVPSMFPLATQKQIKTA